MQTNKEALQEVGKGVAFGLLGMGVFILLIWILNAMSPETKPEERFRVVDTYGPCEIVKYYPKDGAQSAYFLDCK
jgi:hypothetical protein